MNHEQDTSKKQCCGACHKPESELQRRTFIKVLLGGIGLLWAGLTTFPIFRYLASGATEDTASKVTSVTVCKVSELPANSGKNFQFGSKPALLIHEKNGEFKAFDATCSHLGCTVQYQPGENKIFCACHGGQYDAETGQNIAGPPPKPLLPFKVHVQNGDVIVSKV